MEASYCRYRNLTGSAHNAFADWAKKPSPPVGNYGKTLPRTLP